MVCLNFGMRYHSTLILGLGIWARAVLTQRATLGMRYQQGQFDVETISKPSITGDTATMCTVTSDSIIITTAVPIWSCIACPTGFNAIFVSPISVEGLPGVPSPPPGYQPLSVGSNMIATRIHLPTSTSVALERYKYASSASVRTRSGNRGSSSSIPASTRLSLSAVAFSGTSSRAQSSTKLHSPSLVPSGTRGSMSSPAPVPTNAESIVPGKGKSSHSTTKPKASGHPIASNLGIGSGSIIPASSSSPVPMPTGKKATIVPVVNIINGRPMISGGDITSPIPITATKSIDLKGSEASSSGMLIRSKVKSIVPEVQDLIDHPSKEKADDTIKNIKGILPKVLVLVGEVDQDTQHNPRPCSVSTNLISDLFNAAVCLADNLEKVTDDITKSVKDDFKNMRDITNTLQLIQNLEDPLDESKDKEPETSSSASHSNTNKESHSETSESTSSCTKTITASDCRVTCPSRTSSAVTVETQSCSTTCFSTLSGCSVSGSTSTTYSAEACTLPTGSMAAPKGPFQTAWWDYGLSCAGNCAGFITAPSTSIHEATSTEYNPQKSSDNSISDSSRPPSTLLTTSKARPTSPTSPSPTSPSSTSPSSTSPAPASLTVGTIQCISDPGNIKCWKNVHTNLVEETAKEFSNQLGGDNTFTADRLNVTQVLRKDKGVTYMMNIGWIPGCSVVKSQQADHPIAGNEQISFSNLLKDPYYKCTENNGLGGWEDVGCLRYGFYPNNAGVFGSPPHPKKFFDKMSYCG